MGDDEAAPPSPPIFLESDSGERCPLTFASGGSSFAAFVADLAPEYRTPRELARFVELARPLHVDLGPLARWANEDEPDPEDFHGDALTRVARRLGLSPQAYFEREQQRNENAWQSPQHLLTSARELQQVFQVGAASTLPFFEQFGYKELGQDLEDLQEMAAWGVDRGGRVRLVLS